MITNQVALIRRELWEHRSLYVVPAVLGMLIVLLEITGQTAISAFGKHIDTAILGATNIGENERAAIISALMSVVSGLFIFVMWLLILFYSVDALYAERKDRSILFWRSLPVTDAETVLSKLATAVVVIPLITLAFIAATHVLVLIVTSIWVGSRGASAWHLIWEAAPLVDNWGATLVILMAVTIWLSPFVGWFLLVSAYTKRAPILMSLLPIAVLPLLERIFFSSNILIDVLFTRSAKIPIYNRDELKGLFDDEMFRSIGNEGVSLISMLNVGKFLSSASMWGGLLVCGLLTTAAIYVRRFRDDS